MVIVVVAVLLVLALAGGLVWLARVLRRELAALRVASTAELTALRSDSAAQLAQRTAEVDRRLAGLSETVDRRLADLDQKVDRRLESATKTTTAIHERLGKVDAAAVQMLDRAKDLARLEQALRPPKARGGFGELRAPVAAKVAEEAREPDERSGETGCEQQDEDDVCHRADER